MTPPIVRHALRSTRWLLWVSWGTFLFLLVLLALTPFIRFSLAIPIGVALGVTVCSIAILVVATGRARSLFRRARARNGALCPRCAYDLPPEDPAGVCPECGTPFTQDQLRTDWKIS